MKASTKSRYIEETELDRVRRGKRNVKLLCAVLLPTELAGLAYVLNYMFAL